MPMYVLDLHLYAKIKAANAESWFKENEVSNALLAKPGLKFPEQRFGEILLHFARFRQSKKKFRTYPQRKFGELSLALSKFC